MRFQEMLLEIIEKLLVAKCETHIKWKIRQAVYLSCFTAIGRVHCSNEFRRFEHYFVVKLRAIEHEKSSLQILFYNFKMLCSMEILLICSLASRSFGIEI